MAVVSPVPAQMWQRRADRSHLSLAHTWVVHCGCMPHSTRTCQTTRNIGNMRSAVPAALHGLARCQVLNPAHDVQLHHLRDGIASPQGPIEARTHTHMHTHKRGTCARVFCARAGAHTPLRRPRSARGRTPPSGQSPTKADCVHCTRTEPAADRALDRRHRAEQVQPRLATPSPTQSHHICAGTGLAAATSAPGLGSPRHICTGTALGNVCSSTRSRRSTRVRRNTTRRCRCSGARLRSRRAREYP